MTTPPKEDEPKEETQEVHENVILEKESLDAIVKQTQEAIMPGLETAVAEKVAAGQEDILAKFIAKTEEVDDKKVKSAKGDEDEEDDPVTKGISAGLFTEEIAKESKQMRLYRAAKALASGDLMALRRYNQYSLAARTKAGYANQNVDADGGVLVPDPEFDNTVYENLPKYGVAFQYADVRRTDRNSVYLLSLDSGLQFYATAEAGVKTSAKLQFSRQLVELQKYAVIVPATDELTEDAAMDYWNIVTNELTRALAKVADEITFTNATSGITNTTGVITEPVSGAGSTITWDDLLNAEARIEDDVDTSGYRWFMRKETWYRLVQLKGSTNDHYLTGSLASGWRHSINEPTTPWGTPVTFTRVLPSSGSVSANDAYAVYGDLRNYKLYQKNGLAIKMLTEATIKDSENTDFNLATQDGTAMRAVARLLGKLPKGLAGRFAVVGTGTVS